MVGECILKGRTIRRDDLDSRDGAHREIANEQNYSVMTALTVPIRPSDGVAVGALQALNKLQGSFSERDEEQLEAITIRTEQERIRARTATVTWEIFHRCTLTMTAMQAFLSSPQGSHFKMFTVALSLFIVGVTTSPMTRQTAAEKAGYWEQLSNEHPEAVCEKSHHRSREGRA